MDEDAIALAAQYLESVVEGLNLCPYARAARREGRVRMERFCSRHDAAHCAGRLAELARDAEIEAVLLVFDLDAADPRNEARAFKEFLREFQALHRAGGAAPFYSVMFHPGIEERTAPSTPDSLVQVIRRAPIPMIQCLRASVMNAVRAQAQHAAHARLAVVAPGVRLVPTDSLLSRAIAQTNFENHGTGDGRRALEERLRALAAGGSTEPD